jgi:hypothetical protein
LRAASCMSPRTAKCVISQSVEFLAYQVRGLTAQDDLGSTQVGFQFVQRRLSGKGLARCRSFSARFQPLPIGTAQEVFPQAARPASFVERVMRRVGSDDDFHFPSPSPGRGWIFQPPGVSTF